MIRRNVGWVALAAVWLAVLLVAPAHAAPWRDPKWRAAPAWTRTAPPGWRGIPVSVCPFGISDYAAYREHTNRDEWMGVDAPGRALVNIGPLRVRFYVWCDVISIDRS